MQEELLALSELSETRSEAEKMIAGYYRSLTIDTRLASRNFSIITIQLKNVNCMYLPS